MNFKEIKNMGDTSNRLERVDNTTDRRAVRKLVKQRGTTYKIEPVTDYRYLLSDETRRRLEERGK